MVQMNALFEILENLVHLHKALYTIAVDKKEILIKGDVESLTHMMQKEQKLIKAVQATEAARLETVQHIYSHMGLSLPEGSLAELIKVWTSLEEKTRLKHYRDELIRIVTELREANELNQQLLEQSLSFVNVSLDILTDTPEDDFIYKKPTNYGANVQTNRSIFNKKA